MKIALSSDEPYRIHISIRALLEDRGHEVKGYGAIATGREVPWVEAALQPSLDIVSGACDQGIFLCWTGTGIAMAANKVPGIRAALAADAQTARAARVWNHANVLCLSNRTLSEDLAREILDSWFDPTPDPRGNAGVALLEAADSKFRRA